MSHVWDGFRMDVPTIDRALDVIDRFRPEASALLQRWNAELLATTCATAIDRAHARGLAPPATPLADAWTNVEQRRRTAMREDVRQPDVDHDFRLTLFRHATGTYGTIDTECAEWRRAWLDQPEVREFSWWNGADAPAHLTAEEWITRGALWHEMIPSRWPAGTGLVVHLTPRYVHSTVDDVLKAMPTMSDRISRTASDLAFERQAAHVEAITSCGDLLRMATDALEWLSSDEGLAERRRIAETLDLPRIDIEAMLGQQPGTQKEKT